MTHRKRNIGKDEQHLSLPSKSSNLSERKTFSEKQKTLFSRLKKLRNTPTYSEIVFMSKLDKIGVKYIFQKGFIKGDFYCIVDFYLPKPFMLCIEIDGEYHNSKEQKTKDFYKEKYLKSRNFSVLRITNYDAEILSIKDITGLLWNYLTE